VSLYCSRKSGGFTVHQLLQQVFIFIVEVCNTLSHSEFVSVFEFSGSQGNEY
jgi:hypothetical protein